MKKQLIRAAATSVLGLSLMTGFAAADINTTGPGSDNNESTNISSRLSVRNHNRLHVTNTNTQTASTGDANVSENTEGGDAASGFATNDNSLSATASIDNTGAADIAAAVAPSGGLGQAGDISDTGPNSSNNTSFNSTNCVTIRNDNDISIKNRNTQTATSGDANVSNNTTGGSAVSGDATNTNSSSFDLSVSN